MKDLKKLLAVIMIICFTFVVLGCSNKDQDAGNENGKPVTDDNNSVDDTNFDNEVVLKVNDVDIKKYQFTLMMYEEAVLYRNNYPVPEGLTTEEFDEWTLDFWNIELDGKKPIEIVKENALIEAQKYAYNSLKCKENNFSISDAERIDLETMILQENNIEFDEDNPDNYFESTFGVSRNEYLSYEVDKKIFDMNALEMMNDVNIPEDEIREYFDKYSSYYTEVKVSNIFLSLLDENGEVVSDEVKDDIMQRANEILARIKNGDDMSSLITEHSQDPDKADNKGIYVITSDSMYVNELREWASNAKEGDLDIVESTEGINIVRCDEIGGFESAKDEIVEIKRLERYNSNIENEIKGESYAPVINDSVYNSITKIPGDLDLSESMG